jgi:hypothetical protein
MWAQDPYYRRIDASDGLPSNEVYDLFQDSKGFIWITTDDGLCRYDGHSFRSYTAAQQSSRAGANIFEDVRGRIWYENFDGRLYYVSGDTLGSLQQKPPSGFTRAGHVGDRIYVPGPARRVDVYDLRTLRFSHSIDIGVQVHAGVGHMGEHLYWVFGEMQHTAFDRDGRLQYVPTQSPTGQRLNTATDAQGRLLCFDNQNPEHGLYAWEKGRFRYLSDLRTGMVQVYEVAAGRLWICHTRGMEVFDVRTGARVGSRTYFPEASISAVLIDREGNHWFGTTNEGLFFVPDFSSRQIPAPSGGFTRLAVQGEQLVVGTQDGAWMRLEDGAAPGSPRFTPLYQNTSGHAIDFLAFDGDTLIGADPMVHFQHPAGQDLAIVNIAVFKDALRISPHYLAINTPGSSGLYRFPTAGAAGPDLWDAQFTSAPNAMEPKLSDLLVGRGRAVTARPGDTTVFFATSNGLIRLRPHSRHELRYAGRPLYASKLQCDARHTYVLSTAGEFYLIEDDSLLVRMDQLPLAAPYSQMKLLGGKLYLLGRRQLLQLALDGPRPRFSHVISGLQGDRINDLARYRDRLALATDDGLILLDPDQSALAQPPQLRITALRISGRNFAPDALAEVGYEDNEISIQYAILSYRTGGDYPLYYRIRGGSWRKADPGSRQLLLAGLAPGNYDIEFALGTPQSPPAATVRLRVLRPFWMESWFYVLCLLILVVLIAIAIWLRAKRQQARQAQQLERMELENSLRLSTLTAIRSQMNPHFFFNALNTIQAYIFSDDKRNAINYLGKFSKLTRMVLEMSEKELVSLGEELQATTLYLELEKSRFGDDFQFQILLGPGLQPDLVYLPSMIIQPFVENAVKHGLLHQTGYKEVRVSFMAEGEALAITVDDNGIGRKRSEELNRIRKERHRSFAVDASQKRIDLLNSGYGYIGVEYTDKYTPQGIACGTTVKISIPLNLNLNPRL